MTQARLSDLARRRCFRQPLGRIREEEQHLDDWSGRLQRAGRQCLAQAQQRLAALAARLDSLSPLNVLGRGYSLTRRAGDPAVLTSARQVKTGDRLVTHLQQGRIVSRVEAVEADGDGEPVAVPVTVAEDRRTRFMDERGSDDAR